MNIFVIANSIYTYEPRNSEMKKKHRACQIFTLPSNKE